jgi:hypothetical protein
MCFLKTLSDRKKTNNIFEFSEKMLLGFPTLVHVTKNKNYLVIRGYLRQQIISLSWVPMSWVGPVHVCCTKMAENLSFLCQLLITAISSQHNHIQTSVHKQQSQKKDEKSKI